MRARELAGRCRGKAPPIGANDTVHEPDLRQDHLPGIAILKVAKIVSDGVEHFCLIRNLSSHGLVAAVHVPIAPGTRLILMVTDDVALEGTVDWAYNSHLSVRFGDKIDVLGLLGRIGRPESGSRPRMPRLEVDAWGRLRVGARVFSVRLCNISPGGAKLRLQGLDTWGDDVVLTMECFRPLHGVVRWCRDNEAGISFNEPVGLLDLTRWIREVRERTRVP